MWQGYTPVMLGGGDASERRNIKTNPTAGQHEGKHRNTRGHNGGEEAWMMADAIGTVVRGMVVVIIKKEKNGDNLLADGVGKFRSVFSHCGSSCCCGICVRACCCFH